MYREEISAKESMERRLYLAHRAAVRTGLSQARAVVRRLVNEDLPSLDPQTRSILRKRYNALLEADFAHAQCGAYPKSLIFDTPFSGQWPMIGRFARELWRQSRRAQKNLIKDL